MTHGNKSNQLNKGQYESPLKRFARQNECNVLSSGDSGSNLGSLNDREIVKEATQGNGSVTGKSSNKSGSANFGGHYNSNMQFDEVESEQKFAHNPSSYPQQISTTVSFDPQFSRVQSATMSHSNNEELKASS